MDIEPLEPQFTARPPAVRLDGWTGDRMAKFCEALAEGGIVLDACYAVGLSSPSAYAARRRSPLFAAAWEAALVIARDKLADTLLARSIEGSIEQYYKDGELVGERKLVDNRLGLAMLRRLDRLAEGNRPPNRMSPSRLLSQRPAVDWDKALAALESGDPDEICEALAMLQGNEVSEVSDPRNPLTSDGDDDEDAVPDEPETVWEDDGIWWTTYPPPDDYAGEEHGIWGSYGYRRTCAPDERYLLEIAEQAEQASQRATEAEERDTYFAELARELIEDGVLDPDTLNTTSLVEARDKS